MLKILAICGSSRKNSFNKMLLNETIEIMKNTIEIEIFNIGSFPLFNQDMENNLPSEIIEFKNKIKNSDAILFVSPEYNYSISGVLKNAIDWASRPFPDNSWENKPCAIMGASTSGFGTLRAQLALRQTLVFLKMLPINNEFYVSKAQDVFNENGKIIDETLKSKINIHIMALIDWTNKMKSLNK